MNHTRSLDGLRGLAVMIMMMFHFGILMCGWVVISIYFVLSGYLITRILLEIKTLHFGAYLKSFYARRILRIFPIYFAYLFFLLVLYHFGYKIPLFEKNWLFLLTYTYNFTALGAALHSQPYPVTLYYLHLWSLCVEAHFYLLWPFAVYWIPSRFLKMGLIGLCIGVPFLRLWLAEQFFPSSADAFVRGSAVYFFSLSHFDAFALGAAIVFWKLDLELKNAMRLLLIFLSITLTAGGINLFFYPFSREMMTSLGLPIAATAQYQPFWSYILTNLVSAALICVLLNPQGRGAEALNHFFSHRVLTKIGKISYGMYVIHGFLLIKFQEWVHYKSYTLKGVAVFPVYFIIVFICGWLSYRFFESPFLRMKNKFSYLPKPGLTE